MHARFLREDELVKSDELFSIAFNSPFERPAEEAKNENEDTESVESVDRREDNGVQVGDLRVAAFEEDDTTMMSCVYLPIYDVYYDGNYCKMVGIGGVSTPPQYRRRGGIRACFTYALPELYKKGMVFSYLYPFSTAYYSKFGYEAALDMEYYTLKLEHIPSYTGCTGSCYMVTPENRDTAVADIKSVYDNWASKLNMMVQSTEDTFKWVENSNPYKDLIYTFVYRNGAGEATGYMKVSPDIGANGRNLAAWQFMFKDMDAVKGMLGILKSYAADFGSVTIKVPVGTGIDYILREWSFGAVTRNLWLNGMVRVMNVVKALEITRFNGNGEFSVYIEDEIIPQNSGLYTVRYENGRATKIDKDESKTYESVDVKCAKMSIGDFSRLLLGVVGYENMKYLPSVGGDYDEQDYRGVFIHKPGHICEGF